jgi:hypothetical protein
MKPQSLTRLTLSLLISLGGAGCGLPDRDTNQTKSVEIPQSPVKSQGKIGFCWSYATIAFLESLALKKNGEMLNLSEEALGFYRMAEELLALSRKYDASELGTPELVEAKVFEGLEGWDLTFNTAYNPGVKVDGSLELVRAYGVVPESEFPFKFQTAEQTSGFFKTVFDGFAALMNQYGKGHVTKEMVFDLLASKDAYGTRPPASFLQVTADGQRQRITAQSFAADFIGFTPDDYTYMIPDSAIGYNQLVKAIKLTLARGITVPLSYTIFSGQPNSWDGAFSVKGLDPNTLKNAGGHAVLITDFVNQGGKPGVISKAALQAELAKSEDQLDFVVIKNSWSTKYQSPLLRYPGYQIVDQSYLQALARKQTNITIVVPRDIAFDVRYESAHQ